MHQTEEENPPRRSRKKELEPRREVGAVRRKRYSDDDQDQGGEVIECSGKYCKSCTAGLIADCVALCCCPCALLNFFALAFVKIPWMVGRKCLGGGKRKRKKKKKKLERKREKYGDEESFNGDGIERRGGVEEGITWENVVINEEGGDVYEKVWLEMYGVGHLGFGRVSFTGVQ